MVSDKSRSHKKKDCAICKEQQQQQQQQQTLFPHFFILGADKANSHTVVVDRKAVNWSEG